jgi:hypothetical protein
VNYTLALIARSLKTCVLIQVECILTELAFEQSLKVRTKAEVAKKDSGESTTGSPNLVGMINNLVTTDLANIAD